MIGKNKKLIMIAKAHAKYIRVSPQKVRVVIPLIKGENVDKATVVLKLTNKRAAFLLGKVLQSAVANAKNKGYAQDKLFICRVIANSGPVLKRFRAATFGRATMIRKRSAHILVELDSPEKLIDKQAVPRFKVSKKKVVKRKPRAKKTKG